MRFVLNWVWLLIFLFAQVSLYAQQNIQRVHAQYDSLLTAERYDTAKVRLYWRYAVALLGAGEDSVLYLLDKAEALGNKIKMPTAAAGSARMRGQVLQKQLQYAEARVEFEKAIRLYAAIPGQTEALARSTGLLGELYCVDGAVDEGIHYYLKAAGIAQEHGHTGLLADLYTSVSAAFGTLRHMEKVVEYAGKVEQLAIQLKDTIKLINALNNKAAAIGLKNNRDAEVVSIYHQIKRLSDSKDYYNGRFVSRINLGDHYEKKGRLDSALYYLRAAEDLAGQYISQTDMRNIDLHYARIYLQLKDYKKAERHALAAIKSGVPHRDLTTLRYAYACLTRVYAGMGKGDASMDAFTRFQEYADSISSERVSNQVYAFETKYRTLQKDKELSEKQLALAQKNLELKKKNTYMIIATAAALVLLLAGVLAWFLYRQRQKLQAQQLLTLQREHELSTVQAMMDGEEKERLRIAGNLHDGAGSILSAVKLYMGALGNQYHQLSDSPTYQETLGLLNDVAAEIRETSHNLMPRVIQLQGLEAAVQVYGEKLNKSNTIHFEFQSIGAPRRLPRALELMVYRTIQELIGNVLKHAQATRILVQLSFQDDLFSVTVEDNGQGFEPAEPPATGVGLYGLQKRIAAFNGTLDIDSSSTGTSIYLAFKTSEILQEV